MNALMSGSLRVASIYANNELEDQPVNMTEAIGSGLAFAVGNYAIEYFFGETASAFFLTLQTFEALSRIQVIHTTWANLRERNIWNNQPPAPIN